MSDAERDALVGPDWLSAHDSCALVSLHNGSADATTSIAKRAYAGILQTAAGEFHQERRAGRGARDVFITQNVLLPKEFWWAKGEASMDQDWEAGDFSTWIDDTYEWQAFDVKFERIGIEAMLALLVSATEALTGSAEDNGEAAARHAPLPSDEAIRSKMLELSDMGVSRDAAAKVVRLIAGFEGVGNELARRAAKGFLTRGRPKKRQD